MATETLEKRACVFVDFSDGECKRALALLRREGFSVTTIPVVGLFGPKAVINGRLYEDLEGVKRGIEDYKLSH